MEKQIDRGDNDMILLLVVLILVFGFGVIVWGPAWDITAAAPSA
jgi:hypothetical protein